MASTRDNAARGASVDQGVSDMASTSDNAARGASVDQGVSDVSSTIGTSVRLVTLGSGPEYIPEALFAAVASLLESKAALRPTVTWKRLLSNHLNKARRAGGPFATPLWSSILSGP